MCFYPPIERLRFPTYTGTCSGIEKHVCVSQKISMHTDREVEISYEKHVCEKISVRTENVGHSNMQFILHQIMR